MGEIAPTAMLTQRTLGTALVLLVVLFTALACVLDLFPQGNQISTTSADFNTINEPHKNGRKLALLGQFNDAIVEYENASRTRGYSNEKQAELNNDMGVALLSLGKAHQAQRQFEQALHNNPSFLAAYNNLGMALCVEHDYRRARTAFQQALKLQPGNSYASTKLKELPPE